MAGKGDKQRPLLVSREQYERNYDRVFGKKKNGRKTSNTSGTKQSNMDIS